MNQLSSYFTRTVSTFANHNNDNDTLQRRKVPGTARARREKNMQESNFDHADCKDSPILMIIWESWEHGVYPMPERNYWQEHANVLLGRIKRCYFLKRFLVPSWIKGVGHHHIKWLRKGQWAQYWTLSPRFEVQSLPAVLGLTQSNTIPCWTIEVRW